ncbi:S24 family peptidase [Facklamia languida]|uniref:S24 family peptidase n=1 Tax=Facklamia languida TaxID=82347 RepID=UPI0018DB9C4A
MEPLIKENLIIFYKKQPAVENGEVDIMELNGHDVMCKKFYFNGKKAILKSTNQKCKDIFLKVILGILGKLFYRRINHEEKFITISNFIHFRRICSVCIS